MAKAKEETKKPVLKKITLEFHRWKDNPSVEGYLRDVFFFRDTDMQGKPSGNRVVYVIEVDGVKKGVSMNRKADNNAIRNLKIGEYVRFTHAGKKPNKKGIAVNHYELESSCDGEGNLIGDLLEQKGYFDKVKQAPETVEGKADVAEHTDNN